MEDSEWPTVARLHIGELVLDRLGQPLGAEVVLDFLRVKGFDKTPLHAGRRADSPTTRRFARREPLPLTLPKATASASQLSNRLLYSTRAIEFVGREQELSDLAEFASDEREFLWWLWTGPGGAGKSRIALEFCHRLSDDWEVGFLPYSSDFRGWEEWHPEKPTLIVVDYCSTRARGCGSLVVSLSTTPLRHPVRVLLLERERRSPWWTDFLHAESATTRSQILQSQYKQPHELAPLEDEFLWKLVCNLRDEAGVQVNSEEHTLLEELHSIDPLGRPLFAALAAEAISDGTSIRQWNQQQLVESVLSREEGRWRNQLRATLQRDVLVEQYLNLVAVVTVMGGVPLDEAEALFAENELKGLLPSVTEFHPEVYERLFQAVGREPGFPPVEPDVVGEVFVLERLGSRSASGYFGRSIAYCWQHNPGATASFVSRAVLDFPAHENTLLLLQPSERSRSERFWWSVSLVSCAATLAVQSPGAFEELMGNLRQISEDFPLERLLRQHLAMAYFDAAVELLHRRRFGDAHALLSSAHGVSGIPGELVTDVRYNLGLASHGLGDRDKAVDAFSKVLVTQGAPREIRARSLHNRAVVYLQDGRRDDAVADFSTLIHGDWVPTGLKLEALDHLRLLEASVSEEELGLRGPSSQFGGLGALPSLVGIPQAFEKWYEELQRMAARVVERGGEMDAEDLVHEVYLRLWRFSRDEPLTEERFFALAATAMRSAFVDHARRSRSLRRGIPRLRVDLSEAELPVSQQSSADVLDLDFALRKLAHVDERGTRIIEMRFFGGFTLREIAERTGISMRTAQVLLRRALDHLRALLDVE